MAGESDHRTDYLRNWELFEAETQFFTLVKRSKHDRFRVYQDHQNFEVWGKREGRITALPTKEQALERMDHQYASQEPNLKDENS